MSIRSVMVNKMCVSENDGETRGGSITFMSMEWEVCGKMSIVFNARIVIIFVYARWVLAKLGVTTLSVHVFHSALTIFNLQCTVIC